MVNKVTMMMISEEEAKRLIVLIDIALSKRDFVNEVMRSEAEQYKNKLKNLKYEEFIL